MNSGDYRHVVDLEERVEVQRSSGGVEWTWRTWAANVRAAIEPTSGSKKWAQAQLQAEVSTVIRIRFRPGVNAKMRVRHVREVSGSPQLVDFYEILAAVDPKLARRELQLQCVLRPAEGFRTYGTG